ncbi:MAG: XRE family transcriptional regulator [Muribaculaceae bacterium]|nr:XRE family transcriptional regulator [Muribaculaceae bacterium]
MDNNSIDHTLQQPPQTSLDRLRYLIRHFRLTQAEFARRISIDPSNLSKVLSGRLPVTDGLINRLVADLGVSKRWMRDGSDLPFGKEELPGHLLMSSDDIHPLPPSRRHGVPVYDIDVTAGCTELSRVFTSDNISGYIDLPRINPDCVIVRVSGQSMSPSVPNGCFIAIRPVSVSGTIFWGQIYVIVLEDYRMVKMVRRHPDPSMVILHSENPQYDDIEIPRSDIQALFLVESIINCTTLC